MALKTPKNETSHCEVTLMGYICTSFSYGLMLFFGYIRDYFCLMFFGSEVSPKGYAPLLDGFNVHYTRHVYGRIHDCWNRPITSTPGAWVDVQERTGEPFFGNLKSTGKAKSCLNLGSYNYLGFSESTEMCLNDDLEILSKFASSCCSSRLQMGTTSFHRQLEKEFARFLGKDDAIVYSMGYGTNTTSIPSLIGKGGLIVSDSLNHASLALGCRLSGATIKIFQHNDPHDLERVLKQAIQHGQPRKFGTYKPWNKILIIVEGLYSMEGDIVCLPEIIALKKKYKAFLYVDEAHSIGSLGKSGRGVCEYWGVNHSDVEVLMGTFTKSFASCGGYIAADQHLIDALRSSSVNGFYDTAMPSVCAQQILSALKVLKGEDGTDLGQKKNQITPKK